MDKELRERRKLLVGSACKTWFEQMCFMFTGRKVDIPEHIAFSLFMQGDAMCAFGEYILDPTESRLTILNNTVYAVGWADFKF